jgi:hypothetical protein
MSTKMELIEGQVWSYKSRTAESDSEARVIKIDDFGVHISLNNLKVVNPETSSGYSSEVSHFPMDLKAFEDSVIELKRIDDHFEEDYLSGFDVWLEENTNGDAGYFTVSIREAVQFIEDTLTQ